MDSNRSHRPIISTGTTSIVLIFVMLSLLTFAVLSLVSAQANLRLSEKSAQRTTDYYAAENAANDLLTDILSAVDAGEAPDTVRGVRLTADGHAAYEVPLGEDQLLAVEVALYPQGGPDGRAYDIVAWKAVSEYDWSPDDSLHLLDPSSLPIG